MKLLPENVLRFTSPERRWYYGSEDPEVQALRRYVMERIRDLGSITE